MQKPCSILLFAMAAICCATVHAEPAAPAKDKLPERLKKHVVFLCQLDPPRSYRHPESLKKATDYIAAQFRKAGLKVEFQEFHAKGKTYRNVIGLLGDAEGKRIVIGAHYDVAGEMPGADDNASGIAGLIELAHGLGGGQFNHALEFVAYANEEPPFFGTPHMGSAHHADRIAKAKVPVTMMIGLDMIGHYSDEPGSQKYPMPWMSSLFPTKGTFLGVLGRLEDAQRVQPFGQAMEQANDLPVVTAALPVIRNFSDLSDHRNYWAHNIPAVMIGDTAMFRNPHYHRPTDTPDTLDYKRMGLAVKAMQAGIEHLAKRKKSP